MAFEEQLLAHQGAMERLVYRKVQNVHDAMDIIADVKLLAFKNYCALRSPALFRPWLFAIARNTCYRYYRDRKLMEPLESWDGPGGAEMEIDPGDVYGTMALLKEWQSQVLRLHYIEGYSIEEIAGKLNVSPGTIKSRLHTAREQFRTHYPHPRMKGEIHMHNTFPKTMPALQIHPSDQAPFEVTSTEAPASFTPLQLGAKSQYAFYDQPDGSLTGITKTNIARRARIHDIECLEIEEEETEIGGETVYRKLYTRLTDTHAQFIAESHLEDNGAMVLSTFLDEGWMDTWGSGDDNIGTPVLRKISGNFKRENLNEYIAKDVGKPDVLGRFTVRIGNRSFDTIAWGDLAQQGVLVIYYIDQEGRTVLFRRYNREDWKIGNPYKTTWAERFPQSDRIIINDKLYIHWYDCLPKASL